MAGTASVIRRRLLHLAICAPFALTGCDFDAPAPSRTPAPPTPEPPISTLSATLMISAAQIAGILNNMTEYRVADLENQQVNCGGARCHLSLHATRTGPITVAADGGFLTVRLPFAVNIDAAAPGFLSFLRAKATGQGIAIARTELAAEQGWRLQSNTSGVIHLNNGQLRIGPVVTNIAQLWNDNAQSLSAPLWQSINRQIESVNIQSRLAALWTQTFMPLRVGKNPASWLVLRPERFELAQPIIRNGAIVVSLGVAARGRVVVQDQQPANPPLPMPRASTLATPSDTFAFVVPLLLPYETAAKLALASLARDPPRIAGMTLTFTRLQILPSGQDVVVVTHLCVNPNWNLVGWLASCGTVYLRGVPRFDPIKQTIRVTGLRYDIAGSNLILRAVRALAGDRLTDNMQTHLVFDESKELDRLKAQVITTIAKPEGRDVSISAQIQTIGEPSFSWTVDGFMAYFSAKGKVTAEFNL